ncbi:MAG: adenosylcobinamide-GDP ribazoletransferase [bacterium]
MESLFFAINFLTILPFEKFSKNIKEEKIKDSVLFFPVVGILLGLLLSTVHLILRNMFSPLVLGAFIVTILAILTGGLHLDGFIDSVDGLFGGKNKDDILRIMKDHNVGAFGVIGVVCLLMLKFALIGSLSKDIFLKAVFIMPVLSRSSMSFVLLLTPSSKSNGLGNAFAGERKAVYWLIPVLISYILAILLFGVKGNFITFFVFLFALIVRGYFLRKIGGVTGDTLGMLNELVEVFVLFCVRGFS